MRFALIIAFILIVAVGGVLGYRAWNSGPPLVLPAPAQLQTIAKGSPLSGSWTNVSSIDLRIRETGELSGIDVELRPADQSFTDSPTITVSDIGRVACKSCSASGTVPVHVHLADGAYHWQARLHNDRGVSPWMVFPGSIRIDTSPPKVTALTSATDPDPAKLYHSSTMQFAWQAQDDGSGISGYAYRLDHDPNGMPHELIRTGSTTVTLQGLDTGAWYFHIRGLDRVGNWGKPATFKVRIDVTPPGLQRVSFSRYDFDPRYDNLQIAFAVNRPATTVRVGVYQQGDGSLVRLYRLHDIAQGRTTTVTWDGKSALGSYVGAGAYMVFIRTIDAYGHTIVQGWRDFQVIYKRIVISLSQQKLVAYDGNQVFATSLVTTGNPKLPTPTGTFRILVKFHPFTFHSPWPKSSPFWYPPSKTEWAMLFQSDGYYIHDAPWRSVFGPGSNQQIGTPGQNYTGTHGCINVPADVAQKLFAWAPIGTVVQVVN
jgi:lipoprotein-anchoring transpeptidase ErfK/SrfK